MPDGPWIDVTLFSIGGVPFTRKTIIIASGGIAGIIIAIIVIFASVLGGSVNN